MTAGSGASDVSTLDDLVERAVVDLTAASGGQALCAISRSGRPAPAAKYHEGRWAALTELRRSSPEGEVSAARAVQDRWRQELQTLLQREADANWLAYAEGGVDALTDYLSVLER